jgi:hypothetical protein
MKLSEDHPDTLTIMAFLASTYTHQGRWEEAEKLEVQVMETRKTKLGENQPSTLTSVWRKYRVIDFMAAEITLSSITQKAR